MGSGAAVFGSASVGYQSVKYTAPTFSGDAKTFSSWLEVFFMAANTANLLEPFEEGGAEIPVNSEQSRVQLSRVREDNEGALALVQNPFSSARSKHIDVRFHFIRELFKAGKITADYVSTEEQHADMLTKVLGGIIAVNATAIRTIRCNLSAKTSAAAATSGDSGSGSGGTGSGNGGSGNGGSGSGGSDGSDGSGSSGSGSGTAAPPVSGARASPRVSSAGSASSSRSASARQHSVGCINSAQTSKAMPPEVRNDLMAWFQDATNASKRKARENSEKRSADKRAKRVEEIANNPAAPEREESIERDRAVVSLAKRRGARAKAANAAGRRFTSRGAMAKRTPTKDAQVPVYDRIKKFSDQTFYMADAGKMACRACFGKVISLHSYRVKDRIDGKKHQKRVAMMLDTEEEDKGTLRAFTKRSEAQKDKLTQIKAVKGCLAAGVPLNVLGNRVFGAFLAHLDVDLPSAGHLAEHIPLILEEERVRRLGMLKKSMMADDIAGEVNRIVTHEYSLDPNKCRAIIGDSCAANLLAMGALVKLFRYAIVIGCLSHTFNNIGKQLSTPELGTFLGKMHALLLHSAGAKALFKEKVRVRAPSTPGHRWGSRFDRDYIIAMNWPGVLEFIAAYKSGDTDKSKAAKFMRDELVRFRDDKTPQSLVLQLQLALMVDVGRSVTSATIVLEGDEPLVRAHKTYNIVERFRSKLEVAEDGVFSTDVSLPTVAAFVARLVGQGDDLDYLGTLRQYAHDRIGRHSQARDAKALEMFKAAKLTDYVFMKGRKFTDDAIRSLKVLPFVKSKMVRGLLKEKEDYCMAASDTDAEYAHMAFWNDNKTKLPTWHALMLDVALLYPSSAFMERVFSILRCCFNERQESV
ncbi:unnamed protein product [Ectocarpus sp. CCAP 1310/34]|nr:unnamed protein product [Ectocarpus sp. CCAP 1310/34]